MPHDDGRLAEPANPEQHDDRRAGPGDLRADGQRDDRHDEPRSDQQRPQPQGAHRHLPPQRAVPAFQPDHTALQQADRHGDQAADHQEDNIGRLNMAAVLAQVDRAGHSQDDRQQHDPLSAQRLSHQLPSDDVADDRNDREHPDDL